MGGSLVVFVLEQPQFRAKAKTLGTARHQTDASGLLVVLCRRRKKLLARLVAQVRPRLVALAQGEAGQVVGEAVVDVGLGEAGANDRVLGSAAA